MRPARPNSPTRRCAEETEGRMAAWKLPPISAGLGPGGMGSVSAPAAVAWGGVGFLGST